MNLVILVICSFHHATDVFFAFTVAEAVVVEPVADVVQFGAFPHATDVFSFGDSSVVLLGVLLHDFRG